MKKQPKYALNIGFILLLLLAVIMILHSVFIANSIIRHPMHITATNPQQYFNLPLFQYYKRGLMYLGIELGLVILVVIYILTILHYSLSLKEFQHLTAKLSDNINTSLCQRSIMESEGLHDASKHVIKLQERIRNLINERTKMLASISHDLRIPLTRLRMRVELAEEEKFAEDMINDIDEMAEMITQVLQFSRDDAYHNNQEKIELNGFLKKLADDFALSGYCIDFKPANEPCTINGYPLALRRSINNLLRNATEYAEEVTLSISKNDTQIVILIEDNGPGIPEDKLTSVFNAYTRTNKSKMGGTGLGLNIAQEIIDIHGGKIMLENRQDQQGLRVKITLPI